MARSSRDAPECILTLGVRLLPVDRAEWGRALLGELIGIAPRSERWRFALSGARMTLTAPRPDEAPGGFVVAALAVAALACAGTVGVALLRYPTLVTGGTCLAVGAFLCILVCYVVVGRVVVGQIEAASRVAIRVAVFGAITIASLWLGIGAVASYAPSKPLSTALMVALPVTSFTVGLLGTRMVGTARAGRYASMLAALGAGLLGFVIWVSDTVLNAGRPYDAGLRHDFAASGSRDIATYAVNDSLGSAMVLLLLIPLLAATFGMLGATSRGARR